MTEPAVDHYADPSWCEAQYNPRLTVPNAPDIYARWPAEAARVRAALPHEADIPYGDHPREVMDVFRAQNSRGALIFIHGGYWRAFSKDDWSFLAEALVNAGITVAMPSYPLCPEVRIADIVASCRRCVVKLSRDLLSPGSRAKLVVSGHSAGGYLTGAMFATDWAEYGLPPTPFIGGVSISGVFDLDPLINTSMNEGIKLDMEQARALSLTMKGPRVAAPLALLVGEKEPAEFHRQSAALAVAWPEVARKPVSVPGTNHFTVVEQLGRAGTPVFEETMRLFG